MKILEKQAQKEPCELMELAIEAMCQFVPEPRKV
jgi:hypothetical protein